MTTASQVLATAAGEIGYCRWNDPEAGTKYGRWYAQKVGSSYYGESGVPYCAMFVSWVLCRCGYDFVYAYCPYILRDYASRAVGKTEARPGDLVLFDWGGDGVPDHVGLVEANRGSYIQTIEGNTSRGTGGSQGDGGWVARRTRSLSVVRAIVRPDYDGQAAPAGKDERQLRYESEEPMEFIVLADDKSGNYYCDGSDLHPIHNPDEQVAIETAYRMCYGREIPHFGEFVPGNDKGDPWVARLSDVLRRKVTEPALLD